MTTVLVLMDAKIRRSGVRYASGSAAEYISTMNVNISSKAVVNMSGAFLGQIVP